MKKYLTIDEWNIIEDGFHADSLRMSESVFSMGNGRFGQRGNFEEPYGSDTYPASFVAGISYLDKTRVGWWKNGFPHRYARKPRAANWSRIDLRLIDEELDLAQWDVNQFRRRLDMKSGVSYRDVEATSRRGNCLKIHVEHVCHMAMPDLCMIKYCVTSENYKGRISFLPLLDGTVGNDGGEFPTEKVWHVLGAETTSDYAYLWTQTRHEDAQVCYAMTYEVLKNGKPVSHNPIRIEKERLIGFSVGIDVLPGDEVTLIKYVSIASSLYHERSLLSEQSVRQALQARQTGWNRLLETHCKVWAQIWEETDVTIEGDVAAQQGIRFNIFQLFQTYRGDDPRLNIGPKGFTGEKYGGNTYWNTELCCVPFFLLSQSKDVAQNLLMYRYNQLHKAIENAVKLGFSDGAALFPQVTSNGEECHSEWEVTFEEIHRNNIILYAIVQHADLTGSLDYIATYGLEVMIAICRFWAQRVSFSQHKQRYVILGVTGPDEYENNVDNNWYTNYSCMQSLEITLHFIDVLASTRPDDYARICQKTAFDAARETPYWRDIIHRMYLPVDEERGIFVQNDGFLDKILQPATDIPAHQRPINQHWSWDRILRSCFIKQADVLLGLYLYIIQFDTKTIRRNFHFYEPMTVHESSLSPHIHAILAARIHEVDKAYHLFLHATRLDLDDYNNEVDQGLHVTSMAGSWLVIARGFADLQVMGDKLMLSPVIPKQWQRYAFRFNYRNRTLHVNVTPGEVTLTLLSGEPLEMSLYGNTCRLEHVLHMPLPA